MEKIKKGKKSIFILLTIIFSLIISNVAIADYILGVTDFRDYYVPRPCTKCWTQFDSSQRDSYGRSRQYGIKLCDKHRKRITSDSTYYKAGYTDYNCLAYAYGRNSKCSWMWPQDWGAHPSQSKVKEFFTERGYNVEKYNSKSWDKYKKKKAIFVYANSKGVTHFARTCTLDGKFLEGQKSIAKWGSYALYSSKSMSPYPSDGVYGKCVLICYKK